MAGGLKHTNKLRQGNTAEFMDLYYTLYPRLKNYGRLFIKDTDDVEDIIQESFITLWEKREQIRPDGSVDSLIFVMFRNRCLDYLRLKRLEEESILTGFTRYPEIQYLYHLDFVEDEGKGMEELLLESLNRAIDSLPSKMRQVFISCKIEGKKHKEVADLYGISVKMVEKQISKAKMHIRAKLSKNNPNDLRLLNFLLIF